MTARAAVLSFCLVFPLHALAQAPAESSYLMRWGATGSIGYFAPASAVDFGVDVRFGLQLTPLFGTYLDFGYIAGVGLSGSISSNGSTSVSVSGVGIGFLAPMAELDLSHYFIAFGPLFASGGWGQVAEGTDAAGNAYQYVTATSGFTPGLDFRTGFVFGDSTPTQHTGLAVAHGGFSLSFDVKLFYGNVTSVSQQAGPGGGSQSVRLGDHVLGIAPMLFLGYDANR